MTALRLLLLTGLLLSACRSTSSPAAGPVDHELVASSHMGGPLQPAQRAVRSQEAWARLWAQHGEEAPALEGVDFERDMLVLVALGSRPSAGYGVEIVDARAEGGFLRVRAREVRPDAGAPTATVVTSPYAVVRVPRSSGPVSVTLE